MTARDSFGTDPELEYQPTHTHTPLHLHTCKAAHYTQGQTFALVNAKVTIP